MAQKFTPWQKMKSLEDQTRKFNEFSAKNQEKNRVLDQCEITYFNNGKQNVCNKCPYDYNYYTQYDDYCCQIGPEGYNQGAHRSDRKHGFRFLHTFCEEEYPYRKVPLRTSSNYGHRPPIDNLVGQGVGPHRKNAKNDTRAFYRNTGTSYCLNSNASFNEYQIDNLMVQPTWPFRYNSSFGYTYRKPVSNTS